LQVLQEGIIPVLERQLFKCCRTYVQIISDSLFKFAGLRSPIVQGPLREEHKQLLASCYRSCLETAAETKLIKSIAFCCISTGVFSFPAKEAAVIAVETVRQWLAAHPGMLEKVIFNVFTEKDYELYRNTLQAS
jgi:O-acetyl-ADP-ribose deacetylase (regulator of RNase III)